MSAKIHNIKVTSIYIPNGIPIPWETPASSVSVVTDKQREINILEDAEDEELFYDLDFDNPPPNSNIEINAAMGQILISEKDGDGAMMIPLSMVVAIGTKGSVIHPPIVKKGFPPRH